MNMKSPTKLKDANGASSRNDGRARVRPYEARRFIRSFNAYTALSEGRRSSVSRRPSVFVLSWLITSRSVLSRRAPPTSLMRVCSAVIQPLSRWHIRAVHRRNCSIIVKRPAQSYQSEISRFRLRECRDSPLGKRVGISIIANIVLGKFIAIFAECPLFLKGHQATFKIALEALPLGKGQREIELKFSIGLFQPTVVARWKGVDGRRYRVGRDLASQDGAVLVT